MSKVMLIAFVALWGHALILGAFEHGKKKTEPENFWSTFTAVIIHIAMVLGLVYL